MKSIIKRDLSKSERRTKIIKANGCSICNAGAACLLDGPAPDFEVAGVSLVFGVMG